MKTPNTPSPPLRRVAAVSALLISGTLFVTGCVAPKYEMAPPNTSMPMALNLTAEQPPVAATLNAVIVYQGPGSWKREACWDEYLVSITNRGPTPLRLESAQLTDIEGTTLEAGGEPWRLENESRAIEGRPVSDLGNIALVGAGTVALSVVPVTVGTFAALGGSAAGATVAIFTLPAFAAGTLYKNLSRRHAVEAEFALRRLVLPVVIAPGEAAQGSLFFRIAPSPQRLALHCRTETGRLDVTVDLAPLAGLHLVKPGAPSKPKQGGWSYQLIEPRVPDRETRKATLCARLS